MSVDSAGIYHHIVSGVPKHKSHHVTDTESSLKWDKIEAEVAAIKKQNPNAQFQTVHEVPR